MLDWLLYGGNGGRYREKFLRIGRVSCPPQTYKSESLSVGTRSLGDSYVQPAFGTNGLQIAYSSGQ